MCVREIIQEVRGCVWLIREMAKIAFLAKVEEEIYSLAKKFSDTPESVGDL